MSVQNDATGLVDGIVYLTPETDETRTFDVTGLLVAGGAPTLPQGVLRQVVDGVDTVVALQDQPAVASATTITQRLRGFTAGEYRLRLSVLSNGNRRAGTVPIVVVE
jgi:hypothetical protein